MKSPSESREAAKKFRELWILSNESEVGGYQKYWISLLADVLGIDDAMGRISFQIPVPTGKTTKFLDAWIPETKVLIEHKKRGIKLDQPQSGHNGMTPYEQAAEYDAARSYDEKARWIVTCNFDAIWIYDRSRPLDEPQKITLSELPKEVHRLAFLVKSDVQKIDSKELEISVQAGRIVGKLYDALLKQYGSQTPETLAALNRLCVRLVFCLYAEDADIFPKNAFRNLVKATPVDFLRRQLLRLFQTLDTPPDKRDRFLEAELAVFPYTNGGLFRGASESEIPPLTEEIVKLLDGSSGFDWSGISPTIFGALFESTLNPTTRRAGGMVYTSIENIHKVIDPLFLDDLEKRLDDILGDGFNRVERVDRVDGRESNFNAETQRGGEAENILDRINKIDRIGDDENPDNPVKKTLHVSTRLKNLCVNKRQRTALLSLQAEIAALKFLDPACGSGNFLTETYLSLRRLENRIIAALQAGQSELDFGASVKVSISQFYGIEINDFAVTVAKTALWIAEAQMLKETAEILHREPDYLPLKEYDGIVQGNALRMEWGSLLVGSDGVGSDGVRSDGVNSPTPSLTHSPTFSYIIGNPPFVGARNKSSEQAADMEEVFGKSWKGLGNLDYVTCWYKKAADFILAAKDAKVAFVSTNSICQGEAVALLWKPLFESGVEIDFAWRTFRWDNEAQAKAHVHCVIVGFSFNAEAQRRGDSQSCFDRINKIDRIGDDGNPDNPVKKDLHVSTRLKRIFDGDKVIEAANINGYLMDAPNAWIESRTNPICDVPVMGIGNKPIDGGNYLFHEDEMNEFIKKEPASAKYFRPWYGSEEFINGKKRYCLWLGDCSPTELFSLPECMKRVQAVRDFRLASKSEGTRKIADKPTRFHVENMPKGNYLLVPKVSSEKRQYVPMGFMDSQTIASDLVMVIPSATLYHFGVLTSSVHMAWMRTVCGRLKSDYRYSANIVYNNFPWPDVGESDFKRGGEAENVLDRINKIDRIGDGENPDNPVNPVKKTLHVSTRLKNTSAPLRLCVKKTSTNLCDSLRSLRQKIESTAQAILDARAKYPDATLAQMYGDKMYLFPELVAAHAANDAAVMKAYGYAPTMTEPEIVADLMRRYQKICKG